MRSFRIASILWLVLCTVVVVTALAQRGAPAPPAQGATANVTARIATQARAVLASLDDAGRAKVQFPFDSPQKAGWSNLPSPMFQRNGLRLGDLTTPQRTAIMSLLSAALSPDGYRKVQEIMRGDEVLRQTGGGRGGPRGGPPPNDGRASQDAARGADGRGPRGTGPGGRGPGRDGGQGRG